MHDELLETSFLTVFTLYTFILFSHLSSYRPYLIVSAQLQSLRCQQVGCQIATIITLDRDHYQPRHSIALDNVCLAGCQAFIEDWASLYSTDPRPWSYFDFCQSAPGFSMRLHAAEALPSWQDNNERAVETHRCTRMRLWRPRCFCHLNVSLIAWEHNTNWVPLYAFAADLCQSHEICNRLAIESTAMGHQIVWSNNRIDLDGAWDDCYGISSKLELQNPDSFFRSGIFSIRDRFPAVAAEPVEDVLVLEAVATAEESVIAERQFHLPSAADHNSITYQHVGHFGGGYVLNAAEQAESHQIASFWGDVEQAFHEMGEIDLDTMDVRQISDKPEQEDVGCPGPGPSFL